MSLLSHLNSWPCNSSQLLGTALFTTLVFLFPTTFVYYLLFCIPYWLVGAVQLTLRMSVACFNYFPLSACALRLLAPACVPGGVHLELITPAVPLPIPPRTVPLAVAPRLSNRDLGS
jgi:hypothetical protein